MSIINQVLNELEQRGATAPLDAASIRAVPPRPQSPALRYTVLGAVSLMLLALLSWYLMRRSERLPENDVTGLASVSQVIPASSVPVSDAVSGAVVAVELSGASGTVAASQPVATVYGKPLLQVASEEVTEAPSATGKRARGQVRPPAAESPEPVADLPLDNPELFKKVSPQQRAEQEYLNANLALQEGRTNDALKRYEAALLADPTYKPARRAWVGVLVGLKRNDEAEQVLRRGLKRDSHDATFAMMLARLQVERDAVPLGLETLQKTLPYAEEHAEYRSFVAALLQRLGRHDEAVVHYRAALKITPDNGVWWMGLGLSLQALERKDEAREAYQRALASNTLNPQLQAYVQQKLEAL